MDLDAEVIVVGLGTMGSQALWRLAARGVKVLGIEQFEPGHNRGSGHGGSRIFRTVYFEGPQYVPLLHSAYDLWRELEGESGEELLTLTGNLMIGMPDTTLISGALATARAQNLPHEVLTADEIRQRYPQHVVGNDEIGVLDPKAGALRPERAIVAAARRAQELGATVCSGAPVERITMGETVEVTSGGTTYRAKRLVLSPGAWMSEVQPGFPLQVYRVVMTWFRPATLEQFAPERCPIFMREHAGLKWDGIPTLDGATIKVMATTKVPIADPSQLDRTIHDWDLEQPSQVVGQFLRGVDPNPVRAQACMLTFTPDEHFIVGLSPHADNVVLLGGFSGHGFKFAPVMGEIAADLATTGQTRHPIDLFNPARFRAPAAAQQAVPV